MRPLTMPLRIFHSQASTCAWSTAPASIGETHCCAPQKHPQGWSLTFCIQVLALLKRHFPVKPQVTVSTRPVEHTNRHTDSLQHNIQQACNVMCLPQKHMLWAFDAPTKSSAQSFPTKLTLASHAPNWQASSFRLPLLLQEPEVLSALPGETQF